MRVRLFKLKRPKLTFLACLVIAFFMKVSGVFAQSHRIDPELKPYLTYFVDIAKIKGVDLDYIYEGNIVIKFMSEGYLKYTYRGNEVAIAYERDDDKKVTVYVHREKFYQRTEEGRKYVMYHELGHDVLNLPHLDSPNRGMMEPTAYTGFFKNYERFVLERQQKYLYQSLNKMLNRFINKELNLYKK